MISVVMSLSLTYLGLETIAVLDANVALVLTFAEVHEAAERATIIPLLPERFGKHTDLSLLDLDAKELADTEAALRYVASALEEREQRKTGVSKNGAHPILAIIFEATQQRFCI